MRSAPDPRGGADADDALATTGLSDIRVLFCSSRGVDPSGAEMIHLFTIDGHYTAAYWRARAEEARARAEAMHDGYARTAMTTVAQMYDRMAARAEEQEAKGTILTRH